MGFVIPLIFLKTAHSSTIKIPEKVKKSPIPRLSDKNSIFYRISIPIRLKARHSRPLSPLL